MPWLVLRLLALKLRLSSRIKTRTSKPVRAGIIALAVAFLFRPAPVAASVTDTILQTFAEIAFSVAATFTQWIVALIDVMMPIMTYNKFVDNPVVKQGWAIVRDTVNMFFVVILIIIAFGTIFGAEKFKWQQQVPRLLIMAVVINFSKTLSGIMIDFGQVIMLTFANALREIAAGNFIQLLGLNKIYSASVNSTAMTGIQTAASTGPSEFDFFAAGVAAMLLTLWVLATLLIMVVILLFRIVMLWMLVVIAPLAWFVKGAKGIIDSNAYEEWWKEFKCLVGIGPILAFFLWLTLAVAGAGNIATTSGFDVNTTSNNADFLNAIMDVNTFLSFLIGMAMLFAGFKAATDFCSGGIAGGFIGKRLATAKAFSPEKVAKSVAGIGLKAGGFGARLGARGIAATPGAAVAASRYLSPGLRNIPNVINPLSASKRSVVYGALGKVAGSGAIGRGLRGWQQDLEQQRRVKQFEGVNKEKERIKDKGRPWQQAQLDAMLEKPPTSQKGQDTLTALFETVMADPRLQKDLGRDKVKQLWQSQGGAYRQMAQGNAERTGKIDAFERTNADFALEGKSQDEKRKWLKDNIKNADDTKGLAAQAWRDRDIQAHSARIPTSFKKDGRSLNALEAAAAGYYEDDAQKAAIGGTNVSRLEGAQIETQFTSALEVKDTQAAQRVVREMEARYTNPNVSPEDRHAMALSMDRMRAAAAKMGSGGNQSAVDSLTVFDSARGRMENKVRFGLPPVPQTGESGENYVKDNYGQASNDRVDDGVTQFKTQETTTGKAIKDLDDELKGLETAEKDANAGLAKYRQRIETVRSRIEQSTKPEIDAAYNELRVARKLLGEAQKKKDPGQVALGQGLVNDAETAYASVQRSARKEVEDDKDLKSMERALQGYLATTGSTNGEEVVKKSRQLAELKAQAKRIAEVRNALEEERKKRP